MRVHLEGTVNAALSKCSNITTMLRDDCIHSLHTLNIRCLQPILCYWTQHVYPTDMVRRDANERAGSSHAGRMDKGLLEVAAHTQGAFLRDDRIGKRRLRLPSRHRGGALRSHVKTVHAAFACTLAKIAPRLVRSKDEEGNVRVGFLEQIAGEVFGRGHFDADETFEWGGEGRFAEFLEPADDDGAPTLKTRLATEFRDSWGLLRGEMGNPTIGALGAPAESAGLLFEEDRGATASVPKPLRQVTVEREKAEFEKLDAAILRLPSDDMRRLAWLNVDKTSAVWLNALPNSTDRLNNNEFAEVSARYYGMPSPACAPFVGQKIKGRTLDAYGFAVASESLQGDGWRRQHDAIKWRMWEDAREMGQYANTEIYGLFAAHIPQLGRQALNSLPPRKRHGLVPDFMMRLEHENTTEDYLLELKVVHMSRSHYKLAPSEERCLAVKRRARNVPRDYVAKAQTADQKYCHTLPGTVGPIEQRLRNFTHVVPLVFGAYGEVNEGVETLLSQLAELGAKRHWRRMKATNHEVAKGAIAWLLRRRWGMTALRENARLTLDRLQFVGVDTAVDARSTMGCARAESRCKARADALEYSMWGPNVGDTRPPAATRWA